MRKLTLENLLSQTHAAGSFGAAIAHVCNCSLWSARLLAKDANLLDDLLQNHTKTYATVEMQQFLSAANINDETSLKKALRQLRQRVMLRTIYRDLNGLADVHEVVKTTSELAEICLQKAIVFQTAWLQANTGAASGGIDFSRYFYVIGMGKLGGSELNVSSDVDLIFAYEEIDEEKGVWPPTISQHDFYQQFGKKVIAALDDTTEDGFVFRVDMRLRPFGSEGVLVPSIDALEDYYQNSGREWERYAWIKGRLINQSTVAGSQGVLEKRLKPFIFRKYLDYNALANMRELKLQIHRDVLQKGQVDNIKLGRGGIREIEFIAQVFQLMRGGRDVSLQIKPTLAVLNLLKNKGLLPEKTVDELISAYIFLRNCEHRLMYVDDAQTQDLPKTEEAQTRIAKAMRFADWPACLAQLNVHRAQVAAHFDATFNDAQLEKKDDLKAQENTFAAIWKNDREKNTSLQAILDAGYSDAMRIHALFTQLKDSKRYQNLPELSRQRFDALMPLVIQQAALENNADDALLRCIVLLETVCRRASYLALFVEYPQALTIVIKLCAASPWLAQYLTAHPILLDELLDTQTLYAAPNFASMQAELTEKMQSLAGDAEAQMDAMRHFKQAAILRLAAQDVAGNLALETLSDYLSALADLILQVSLTAIWQSFKYKHAESPKFAVIAYGKLGGKELGYVSDLDIIFLYDDTCSGAADSYARFAQRINNWFNSTTNAGLLYETDLQLRPDGNSGLLVSSVEAFRDYQLNKAWVWEHQALTRARFVAGDAHIGAAFEQIRTEVLMQVRDDEKLQQEVLQMREKMRAAQKIQVDVFDLKHSPGGIVDVEFLVQFLVLKHAKNNKQLIKNIGNIALLIELAKLNLIDAGLAKKVADAYRAYRQFIHQAKLQEKPATLQLAQLVPPLVDQLIQHQQAVLQLWQTNFTI